MSKESGLILLLCASIAGISFWMGRNYPARDAVTVQTVSNESYKTTLQGLEQKVLQISEVDFAEYRALKDRKAQYEKAEEILAKIMGIFVAELGLRMAEGNLGKLGQKSPEPLPEPAAPPAASSRKKSEPQRTPPPVAAAAEAPNWRAKEQKLREVYGEGDAESFLKAVVVDNLFTSIRGARASTRKALEEMNGRFYGQIRFNDPKDKPKDMEMNVEIKGSGEEAEGEYKIVISQNNVVESDTSGKGQFRHFFSNGDSSAILVRATPNTYAQLYWSQQLNQFFGNYYKEDAVDKFSPAGVVFLRRR